MNTEEQIQLDPEDIILLILEANKNILGKDTFCGVTRLEKLLFLLQKETDFEGIDSFYHFSPHNFGPFSKEVYEALEFLESCDLISVKERVYNSRYATVGELLLLQEISEQDVSEDATNEDLAATEKLFFLTGNGNKVAEKLQEAINNRRPNDIKNLYGIISRYGILPLNQLIRYVYKKYPQMVVKSIHPEAQRIKIDNNQ